MGRVNTKCPNCGSENLGMMVDVTFSMDIDKYRNLTKSKLRRNDVVIQGIDWSDADIICKDCANIVKLGRTAHRLYKRENLENGE